MDGVLIESKEAWFRVTNDAARTLGAARAAGVWFIGLGIDGDDRVGGLWELGERLGVWVARPR